MLLNEILEKKISAFAQQCVQMLKSENSADDQALLQDALKMIQGILSAHQNEAFSNPEFEKYKELKTKVNSLLPEISQQQNLGNRSIGLFMLGNIASNQLHNQTQHNAQQLFANLLKLTEPNKSAELSQEFAQAQKKNNARVFVVKKLDEIFKAIPEARLEELVSKNEDCPDISSPSYSL